ncbi:MAG: transposase [Candidatus Onthomonas sp.]
MERDGLPQRKSLRLKTFDYSAPGYYFVTVCVKNRECLFCYRQPRRGAHCAPVSPVKFQPTEIGSIVDNAIKRIPVHYPSAMVEKYVIMPNHIHLILVLSGNDGRTMCAPTTSRIIHHMKEYVTKRLHYSIWQKSYYDHIIRDEQDFQRIWNYIDTNPQKWEDDCYYKESD